MTNISMDLDSDNENENEQLLEPSLCKELADQKVENLLKSSIFCFLINQYDVRDDYIKRSLADIFHIRNDLFDVS